MPSPKHALGFFFVAGNVNRNVAGLARNCGPESAFG